MRRRILFSIFLASVGIVSLDAISSGAEERIESHVTEQTNQYTPVDSERIVPQEPVVGGSVKAFDPCSIPGNESVCEQNKSLYEEFKNTKDGSLCERLQGPPGVKDTCFDSTRLFFAVTGKDTASCEAVKDGGLRQRCYELVKQSLEDPNFSFSVPPFEQLPFLWGKLSHEP